jgi:hemerythrin-like metal-binding protein
VAVKFRERFTWSDDILCGIEVVDLQHRKYFGLANALLISVEKGGTVPKLQEAFDFLRLYVVEHFGTEETLMAEHAYPEQARHHREHLHFRRELDKARGLLLPETVAGADAVEELTALLIAWFVKHIRSADTVFCEFLRERVRHDRSLLSKLAALARAFTGRR